MKKLFWVFPILFLIDNVLGLNGYQFTIFGVGIRIILFALSVGSLCLHCLYTIKTQNICLFKRQPNRQHLLNFVKPIDGFVLGFLALNFIWATVIPLLKHGNISYAVSDFSTVLVLVLYFPCAFLIRTKELTLHEICKWFFPLLLLLALWHSVMYIGEVIKPGFYAGYYDFIDVISFGTAVRTDVIMGYGITRIIQVTSVFLIPAFLLALQKTATQRKPLSIAAMALILFAILITYTKSIWFGILAGFAVAVLGIMVFSKDLTTKKRSGAFTLALVVFFCIFNFGFLNNTIVSRATNSARPDAIASLESQIADLQHQLEQMDGTSSETNAADSEELANQLKELEEKRKDASGTAEANALRAKQNTALQEKWAESKWIGHGYGAYVADCIRNESFPYMYESLLPALLMKLGLVGLAFWGIFVLALVVFAAKAMWKKPVKFWCWIGTALAYAMAVQTNPLLFTFAGMSLMLYLLLFIADTQEEAENQ